MLCAELEAFRRMQTLRIYFIHLQPYFILFVCLFCFTLTVPSVYYISLTKFVPTFYPYVLILS